MRNKLLFLLLGATIPILLSSCQSRVLMNNALRSDLHLTRNELIGLPVATSAKISLYAGDLREGKKGRGNMPEEITIPKGTPGVVVFAFASKLVVRFEYGEGKTLVFGANDETSSYELMARSWENGHGSLQYGGYTYFASPGSSKAALIINWSDLGLSPKKHRKVRGLRH